MAQTKSKWSKGHLVFYNGPVRYGDFVKSTSACSLNAFGIQSLDSTAAATFTLGTPFEGIHNVLIAETTFAHTLRGSTVKNQVVFGRDGSSYNSLVLTPSSKAVFKGGQPVSLIGASSTRWIVILGEATGPQVAWSTACT